MKRQIAPQRARFLFKVILIILVVFLALAGEIAKIGSEGYSRTSAE